MLNIIFITLIIFLLTVVMIMSGRGGGNFYVIALVLSNVPIHMASTTSQFILIASSLAGSFIFGKAKIISWPLLLFFGGLNSSMAFIGGLKAHQFSGTALQIILSTALFIAGIAMFFPEKESAKNNIRKFGYWNVTEGENTYVINLWLAAPLTLITGFFSGMVGISGGSFLIPLMVVGCGVPMRIAVGTATAMLAATAIAGFTGNAIHGGFHPQLALSCGAAAFIGGFIGSKIALKTKPKKLKTISGIITVVASLIMFANALSGK